MPVETSTPRTGTPERATGMFVTANYFPLLGIRPAQGRFFLPEEDVSPGTHPVVVLSYGCWSRLFGADPGVASENQLVTHMRPLTAASTHASVLASTGA